MKRKIQKLFVACLLATVVATAVPIQSYAEEMQDNGGSVISYSADTVSDVPDDETDEATTEKVAEKEKETIEATTEKVDSGDNNATIATEEMPQNIVEPQDAEGEVQEDVKLDGYINLQGICYVDHNYGIDVGVAYDTNEQNIEFSWKSYNLNTKEWRQISDWNSGNWMTWIPEKGDYWLYVEAKADDGTTTTYTTCFSVSNDYVTKYINLNGLTYTLKADGIDVGVAYDTNEQNIEFSWKSYNLDTKEWEQISDWSEGNWMTWHPTQGNYWLHVEAKTADGLTKDDTICFNVSRDYTQDYVNFNGICYIEKRHSIDVGVSCDTGSSSIQYKWQSYNLDTHVWEQISDWSEGNWMTWTPKKGNYWLQVQAKTANNAVSSYTVCFAVATNHSSDYVDLNGICLQQDYTSTSFGVSYDSSDPNVEFLWQLYDVAQNKWTTISDWTKSNWVTSDVVDGAYWVYVKARTSAGTEEELCQGVNLKDKNYIKLNNITMIKHSKSVDLGLSYDSGDTNMSFLWQIYDLSNNTWMTIADWTGANWVTWNVESGAYWVYVTARNGAGKEVSYCQGINIKKDFNYVAIGNSLTYHPIEAGIWWGNWGMAATTPDKDYYHQVVSGLQQSYDNVSANCIYFKSWESDAANRNQYLGSLDSYLNEQTNLVTVQLGDNIISGKDTLYNDYYNLVNYIKSKAPNAQIMIISSFCWPDGTVTAAQQNTCNALGATYIDLSPISGNPSYRAGTGGSVYGEDGNWHTITNGAVGAHPNDAGFAYIANQILNNIR